MATKPGSQPQREPQPGVGYEPRDADSRWLFGLVGILAICIAIAELVMHSVKEGYERTPPPTDAWSAARPESNPSWTQTVAPRLQVSAPLDLSNFREREEAELTSYGWIDRTSGVVRIPIARAMDRVLEKGLPVRTTNGQSRLGPTPYDLQQQRTNSTQAETVIAR